MKTCLPYPHPILKACAAPVTEITAEVRAVRAAMVEVMAAKLQRRR